MTLDELRQLLLPENLALLEEPGSDDPADFAMRFQGRKDIPARAIAEQIACRRKAVKKLPMLSLHGLLYTSLALEQASGEAAAAYKASIMNGERAIDLTGGLGVDTIFFFKGVLWRGVLRARSGACGACRVQFLQARQCQCGNAAWRESFHAAFVSR